MLPLGLHKSLGLSVPLGRPQRNVRPALGQLSPPAAQSLLQIPSSLTLGQKLQADFLDRSATNGGIRLPANTTSSLPISAQLVDRTAFSQEAHPIDQFKGSEAPVPAPHALPKPLEQLKPLSARPPLSQVSNFLTLQTASEPTHPAIAPLSNLSQLKGKGATPTPEAIKAQVQTQVQAQVNRQSALSSDLQAHPISSEPIIQRPTNPAPGASELATLIPAIAASTAEVLSAEDTPTEDTQPSSALLQSSLEPNRNLLQNNLQSLSDPEQSTDDPSEPFALLDPSNPFLSHPPNLPEIQTQVKQASDGAVSVTAEANPVSLEPLCESLNIVQLQVEPAQINSQDQYSSDPNPSQLRPASSKQLPESQVPESQASFAQPTSDIASDPTAKESISKPGQPTIQREEIQSRAERIAEPREAIDSISSSIELQSQKMPLPQLEGWESNKTISSISETVQTYPAAPTPSMRPGEARLPDPAIPEIDSLPSPSIEAATSRTVSPEPLQVTVQTGQEEFETETFQEEPLANEVQRSLDQTQLHSMLFSEQAGADVSLSPTNVQSSFQQAVQQPEESVSQPATPRKVPAQTELTVNSLFDLASPILDPILELSKQASNPLLQPTVQQPTTNEAAALPPQILQPHLELELDGETSAIHSSQPSAIDEDSFASEQPSRLLPESTAGIQPPVERSLGQSIDEGTASKPNDLAALLPQQSNVDIISQGHPLLQPKLESQLPVLEVQRRSSSVPSELQIEPEQNNSAQQSEAIDLSTEPSIHRFIQSVQPIDPLLPPDAVPAVPTIATDLSVPPQVQPTIQAKVIWAETTMESQIADRSPQPLPSNLSTGESTKVDNTYNNSDIPLLDRRQPLGHSAPLASLSDLLMPKRKARSPNSPSVEATSNSALSTTSKMPNSAIAAIDTPNAWASIDELLGQPLLNQTAVQTESWQEQFNLHSDSHLASETLVNRFTEPSTGVGLNLQIAQNSEMGREQHHTLSSSLLSSAEVGQTARARAPAELELLAQMVYGLMRDRFAIDKERYLQVAASHPPWIDIVSANSFKSVASTAEIKSVNIQLQPTATTHPAQRQLEALTQAVYQLIWLRLEQDRERRIY